jgi:hypothetical protein
LEHTNVLSWALKRYNRYSTYVCFSPQGSDIRHHRALLTAFSSKGRKRNCGKLFWTCFLSIEMVFIDWWTWRMPLRKLKSLKNVVWL